VDGGDGADPLAYLVVHGGDETRVPIFDQLFVGRECAGISDGRRLVLDEKHISRNHFEIRLVANLDLAVIIDTSTNGTLLNGMPLARTVAQPIKAGDRIAVGDVAMTFHSSRFRVLGQHGPAQTLARINESDMVMVVGDIVNYSTMSQITGSRVIAESLHTLWSEVDELLREHRGTLDHYAGDALYAVWDLGAVPAAHAWAIDFALAADRLVRSVAATLSLRDAGGDPLRMGWSVVQGAGAQAAMARSIATVLGDATNLAFRLAGIAGRDGRAPVIVTDKVRRAAGARYTWGEPEAVTVKGRTGTETVYEVLGATAAAPPPPAG
jgi:adenylate cyclase